MDRVLGVLVRRYQCQQRLTLIVNETPASCLELLTGSAPGALNDLVTRDVETVDRVHGRARVQAALKLEPFRLLVHRKRIYFLLGKEQVHGFGGLLAQEIHANVTRVELLR